MYKFKLGCKQEHLESLLYSEQTVPQDSLFHDDLFEKSCDKIRNRNELIVIQDIGSLVVPSAQILAIYGAIYLDYLFKCVNEGWNTAISFYSTCPQPNYSVGFGRSVFIEEQLEKLEPFVGETQGMEACQHYWNVGRRRDNFKYIRRGPELQLSGSRCQGQGICSQANAQDMMRMRWHR